MFSGSLRATILLVVLLLAAPAAHAQLVRPVVGEDSTYVAQEGDDLLSIAQTHRLAIEHLAFANGFPVTSIDVVPGSSLIIPGRRVLPESPPRDGLVLNIPERGLYLFKNGRFADFIPVSVGHFPDAPTPMGRFSVIEKVIDPTWYPTAKANQRKPVPPGPDNPLGDRWIGLSAPNVGIHGTNNPLDVGAPVTLGCIRCYPDEVRQLFPKVFVGMPIRIEYESAKLGKSAQGEIVLATFPDIYQRSDPYQRSVKLLKKVGMTGLLDNPNFVQRLKLDLGIPLTLKPKS